MKKRIESLQVIRALAFLGIFTSHSGTVAFAGGGPWGVSVFLVLSGFLMFCSYCDTDRIKNIGFVSNIKFGVGKVKKLYSLHIITMFLAVPFSVRSIDYSEIGRFVNLAIKIIFNVLLLQSWIPNNEIYFSLNAVAWYLSVSLFLYTMFPFVLSAIKRYKGITTAIKMILCVFVLQIIMAIISRYIQINLINDEDFIHWFTYIFPLSRFEDFIIGCNLGYIYKKTNNNFNGKKLRVFFTFSEIIIVLLILVQLVMYVLIVSIPAKDDLAISSENWWCLTIYWTVTSSVFVYLFALNQGKLSRVLTNKPLLYVGNMSTNAFLIHQIIYRYLDALERKHGGGNSYINIFLCFILTIVSSAIWKRTIEYFRGTKLRKQGDSSIS